MFVSVGEVCFLDANDVIVLGKVLDVLFYIVPSPDAESGLGVKREGIGIISSYLNEREE